MSTYYDQQWAAGQPPLIVNLSGGGGGGSFVPDAVASDLLPDTDSTWDLGSPSFRWSDLYCNTLRPTTVIASGNVTAANVTVSGALGGASANISGTLTVATIAASAVGVSGPLTVTGLLQAQDDVTVTGTLTVGTLLMATSNIGISSGTSLGLTGAFSAASVSASGALSAGSIGTATIANSGTITTANITCSGQIETPSIQSPSPIQIGNTVYPSVHNSFGCGTSGNRWANLWAVNADVTNLSVGSITVVSSLTVLGSIGFSGALTATTMSATGFSSTGDVTATLNVNAGGALQAPRLNTTDVYTDTLRVYAGSEITVYDNLVPSGSKTLGKSGTPWTAAYITTLGGVTVNVGQVNTNSLYTQFLGGTGGVSNIQPINHVQPTGSLTLGTSGARWTNTYTDALTVTNALTATNATVSSIVNCGQVTANSVYTQFLGGPGGSGNVQVLNNVVPGAAATLGTTGTRWSKIWVDSITITNDLTTSTFSTTTFTAGSTTLGVSTGTSLTLSGALASAGATISGTAALSSVTAANVTASGGISSATMYTSGVAQHDGGMLGNVRAIGSFSEANTILHYEYNDLEDCTTIRNVRNSHSPRIELGYLGNKIRVTGGLYQGADSIGISNSMKNAISIYTNGTLVPDATTVTFAFTNTSESHGDQSVFDFNGVMPGILVFKKAGLVHISYTVRFDPNGTGFRQATLGRGDVSNPPTMLGLGTSGVTNVANVNATYLNASATLVVNADQYVTVYVYQNSGGDLVTVLNMSAVYL